jgi:hypothetical protein
LDTFTLRKLQKFVDEGDEKKKRLASVVLPISVNKPVDFFKDSSEPIVKKPRRNSTTIIPQSNIVPDQISESNNNSNTNFDEMQLPLLISNDDTSEMLFSNEEEGFSGDYLFFISLFFSSFIYLDFGDMDNISNQASF